jgi:hypothetical protein
MFDEIAIAAATVSATVRANRVSTLYANLILPNASWRILASTEQGQAINIFALGADL